MHAPGSRPAHAGQTAAQSLPPPARWQQWRQVTATPALPHGAHYLATYACHPAMALALAHLGITLALDNLPYGPQGTQLAEGDEARRQSAPEAGAGALEASPAQTRSQAQTQSRHSFGQSWFGFSGQSAAASPSAHHRVVGRCCGLEELRRYLRWVHLPWPLPTRRAAATRCAYFYHSGIGTSLRAGCLLVPPRRGKPRQRTWRDRRNAMVRANHDDRSQTWARTHRANHVAVAAHVTHESPIPIHSPYCTPGCHVHRRPQPSDKSWHWRRTGRGLHEPALGHVRGAHQPQLWAWGARAGRCATIAASFARSERVAAVQDFVCVGTAAAALRTS